ncbi:MAG: hypothetical protein DRI74_04935 [Bacteroidetes bacterium]|nr:MAG: hypothetical protein DRI74_04935 [Bacteroidota bacterium]
MNTEQLLKYIANPQSLTQGSLDEIQKLAQLFPYSQNIQLLYLFNLSNIQDIRFGKQLQKTATYVADRSLLKKQIEGLKAIDSKSINIQDESFIEKEKSISETVPLLEKETIVKESVTDDDTNKIIPSSNKSVKLEYDKKPEAKPSDNLIIERNKIRSKAELLQLVKKRLAEIEENKVEKQIKTTSEKSYSEDKEMPLQNKLDLIDKFISVEPSISRPDKVAFFDPDVAAQESLFEDGAFVTETLAKIYSDQANYQKAKEIYQFLSLNNPEKSSYFAALIQELENKIN